MSITKRIHRYLFYALSITASLALIGCGGGSSGGGGAANPEMEGLGVPSQIAAVDNDSGGASSQFAAAGWAFIHVANATADPDGFAATSDIKKDMAFRSSIIDTGSQGVGPGEMLQEIFEMMDQIEYQDTRVCASSQGAAVPYIAIVGVKDRMPNGQNKETSEKWTIKSWNNFDGSGNRTSTTVWGWVDLPPEHGEPAETIRFELVVTEAPDIGTDGSGSLGAWEMCAGISQEGIPNEHNWIWAKAEQTTNEQGDAIEVVKLKDVFGTEEITSMEFYKNRTQGTGWGRANGLLMDFEDHHGPEGGGGGGGPDMEETYLAYNTTTIQIDDHDYNTNAWTETQYLDKSELAKFVDHYGLYNIDGSHLDMTVGKPIIRTNGEGKTEFGWATAFTGRYQIFAGFDAVEAGTEWTEDGVPPGQTPETYTVVVDPQVLERRDVKVLTSFPENKRNQPQMVNLNQFYILRYTSSKWYICEDFGGTVSEEASATFLDSLDASDQPELWVWANTWAGSPPVCTEYVYDADEDKFYEASPDHQTGKLVKDSPAVALTPSEGLFMNVGVNGMIGCMHNGTNLMKVPFSGSQFNPTFDVPNASILTLDNGQEVFFFDHISGTSIVYRKDMNGNESILMENYTTVNRFNVDDIVANGAVFESLWDSNASTFTLDKVTMKLEYYTVNQEDQNNGKSAGDPLTDCAWGLTIQGSASGSAEFNYRPTTVDGNEWEQLKYLQKADQTYVQFSDPIRFDDISVPTESQRASGAAQSEWPPLALFYDGHLGGIYDPYQDFINADGDPTSLKDKMQIIDDYTILTDADTSTQYVVLQLMTRLVPVPDSSPASPPTSQMTLAKALTFSGFPAVIADLALTIPDEKPSAVVKVNRGKFITDE